MLILEGMNVTHIIEDALFRALLSCRVDCESWTKKLYPLFLHSILETVDELHIYIYIIYIQLNSMSYRNTTGINSVLKLRSNIYIHIYT